jgi:hypothetical protein
MTTIILLNQYYNLPGVYDGTNDIVNYHVHLTQARFNDQLEERMFTVQSANLTGLESPYSYGDYTATINRLNSREAWSVYDHRVLFFFEEFVRLVNDARLLFVDLAQPETSYQQEVRKRSAKAFEQFAGPKLHLTTDDPELVGRFVAGEDVTQEQVTELDQPVKKRKAKDDHGIGA